MLVQETVSMVKPQKCINPPTLIKVRITQPRTWNLIFDMKKRYRNICLTWRLAEKLKSKIHVVINTQVIASKTFL